MRPHPKQAATPAVWITIICILAVVGAIGWWAQKPGAIIAPTAVPVEKKIQLTLANGEVVDISGNHQILQSPDATIYISAKGITYSPKGAGVTSWNTLQVPERKMYTLVLADGTKVLMNGKTTIRFKFVNAGRSKQLFIDGEAYFRLVPGDTTLLTVHTPVTDITASGADFLINSYDREHVRTILVRGSVTVTDQRTTVTLKPGTEAVYNVDNDFSVKTVNLPEVMSWTKKIQANNELSQQISNFNP
ncbi:MAG: FecR domain-containing protein [Chitinophaga sp.]|uniref:FecR family protein n=1 Tax=Chitinophaga sp. TaxID=1869181 RepID=UPI0025BEF408|nr:FecR family protein [Chitinophaga sp.]MBV8255303.1 FecR domain-containing protein [Chitinophaga sp.]